VGRFTTEIIPVELGNGMWDVSNATFEEIPQQAMLEYPSDWAHDAVAFFITNDFADQKLAVSGTWTQTARAAVAGAQGTEHVSLSTVATPYVTMDDAGTPGDWACYEYRGYGFRLYMLQGPEFGSADLYIDDVFVETLNLYAATEMGPQIVYAQPSMALDIHRVKMVCDGASLLPLPVVNTAPVLQDLADTLSVALASDILGGALAVTNALGVASNLPLGTAGSTDTLAHLAATINAGAYGITATVTGSTAMTLAEPLLANIVGSSLTDTTTGSVVKTPPVLASLAGTLSVANASDILGGTLAITNAVGAISNLALGTSGTTDTLAHLAATINAGGYGITATVTGGTAMTFAEPLLANIVGSNLTDTTPGIAGTLSVGGGLLGGSLTITDATGAAHPVTLGAAGTTDTLANLATYLNVTNAAWGITATVNSAGTAMTFAGTNSICNVFGSCATAVSWYALEVMR
jgi:hypothetical protein